MEAKERHSCSRQKRRPGTPYPTHCKATDSLLDAASPALLLACAEQHAGRQRWGREPEPRLQSRQRGLAKKDHPLPFPFSFFCRDRGGWGTRPQCGWDALANLCTIGGAAPTLHIEGSGTGALSQVRRCGEEAMLCLVKGGGGMALLSRSHMALLARCPARSSARMRQTPPLRSGKHSWEELWIGGGERLATVIWHSLHKHIVLVFQVHQAGSTKTVF